MPRSREITREKFNGTTAVKGIRWRNKEVRPGLTKYCKVLCIELYRILSPKIYRWFPQYTDGFCEHLREFSFYYDKSNVLYHTLYKNIV